MSSVKVLALAVAVFLVVCLLPSPSDAYCQQAVWVCSGNCGASLTRCTNAANFKWVCVPARDDIAMKAAKNTCDCRCPKIVCSSYNRNDIFCINTVSGEKIKMSTIQEANALEATNKQCCKDLGC